MGELIEGGRQALWQAGRRTIGGDGLLNDVQHLLRLRKHQRPVPLRVPRPQHLHRTLKVLRGF